MLENFISSSINVLDHWQTLAGSLIGAAIPFLLWGYIEQYNKRKRKKEYLYYLQRVIVDQINLIIEIRETTQKFLDFKLNILLHNISSNPNSAYSVDTVFFPLISVRPIPQNVNAISSDSGYIDNKVAKIYAMSEDFPHIINDIRLQLRDTLEKNEKIAFGKKNSPEVQKEQFKQNIEQYKKMLEDDLLGKNIPAYIKKLVETLIAVETKARTGYFHWKIKFDPRWKFYTQKNTYLKAKGQVMEKMDKYFESAVNIKLELINKMFEENR